MLVFNCLLIMGFFHKSLTIARKCTKEDLCLSVPARACDNSLCQPITMEEWNALGEGGLKLYSGTIVQKTFNNFCPLVYTFENGTSDDGRIMQTMRIQSKTGLDCNITTILKKVYYPDEPDQNTGRHKIFTTVQAGDLYEVCIPYFEPGQALVYRSCRIDPPPAYGEGCASFYAQEAESGHCNRTTFVAFLNSLKIPFPQTTVDCL